MSRRLVELQEAERRYVARELHDEIGQLLTALKMTLPAHSHPNRAGAAGDLKKARGLVDELTSRVRELSMDLRPAMLDDLGLLPALLWHFERYSAATGVRVNFRHSEIEGRRFEPEIETAAYRIIQEALTNVARHAGVEKAEVVVSSSNERLHIEIEDRGRGFDAGDARIGERSSGLAGMRERASLLGGDFAIESVVAAGTRLKATLPLFKSKRLDRRSTVPRSRPGKVRRRAGENNSIEP